MVRNMPGRFVPVSVVRSLENIRPDYKSSKITKIILLYCRTIPTNTVKSPPETIFQPSLLQAHIILQWFVLVAGNEVEVSIYNHFCSNFLTNSEEKKCTQLVRIGSLKTSAFLGPLLPNSSSTGKTHMLPWPIVVLDWKRNLSARVSFTEFQHSTKKVPPFYRKTAGP